jgi:hypothetical protein
MKILVIQIRGKIYHINEIGQMVRTDMPMKFHDSWIFVGGIHHHWCNSVTRVFKDTWKNPEILLGCLLVDRDHNTLRVWGGRYNGRIPRITKSYITEL